MTANWPLNLVYFLFFLLKCFPINFSNYTKIVKGFVIKDSRSGSILGFKSDPVTDLYRSDPNLQQRWAIELYRTSDYRTLPKTGYLANLNSGYPVSGTSNIQIRLFENLLSGRMLGIRLLPDIQIWLFQNWISGLKIGIQYNPNEHITPFIYRASRHSRIISKKH